MKKNGINLTYATVKSPETTSKWSTQSESDRIDQIRSIVQKKDASWNEKFNIISARKNGFVVFEFVKSIPVSERSKYLLDIESNLCEKLDSAITIWIAPVGDKSSLRKLRGIEVKNI
jgi:hypothetical protein